MVRTFTETEICELLARFVMQEDPTVQPVEATITYKDIRGGDYVTIDIELERIQ